MRRLTCIALFLWTSIASAVEIPTGGTPIRLDITNTSIVSWHMNNGNVTSCDDDLGAGIERLNLNGSWESWVMGVRMDGALYYPAPQPRVATASFDRCLATELTSRYQNSIVPEKLWAGWNGRTFEITAGDSYVSFGRGLTLSLRKTDELGLDTTQRGLRVRMNTDRFSSTLVAGLTNINNVDEASGRWEDDPNDAIIGATADVRIFESIRVGASAASFLFRRPVTTHVGALVDDSFFSPDSFKERWFVGGPKLEAPRLTDWLGIYLEGVAQNRNDVDGNSVTGFGLYGSATAYFGPVTLLFEGKAYGDLEVIQPHFNSLEFEPVQYAALPTLERVAQPLEHTQREITGGRLQADWTINPNVSVYVNHGTFRDDVGYQEPESGDVLPGMIHDPYAGIDARIGPHRIHAEGGVRFVMVDDLAVRRDGHVNFDVQAGLDGGSSLALQVTHLERLEVLPFNAPEWREGTIQLGYRKRPLFAVSAILDYTTDENAPTVWYPGASAEWQFTPSSNVRVFAGSSRGGLRCVSGVCRIFPPFSGVKGSLTLRY